jgi:hypothetical protein
LPYAQEIYRIGESFASAKPLFEQERLALEWFLVPSRVESRDGAVGLQLPGVDGVGELELEEAPDFVAVSRLAQGKSCSTLWSRLRCMRSALPR